MPASLSSLSDDELLAAANGTPVQRNPLAQLSDDELLEAANARIPRPRPSPLADLSDDDLINAANAQTAESYVNQAKRGAVSEGLWMAGEGLANLPRTLATAGGITRFEDNTDAPGPDEDEDADAALNIAAPAMAIGDWMADAYRGARAKFRRENPVHPAVEQSTVGQVVQGLGQAAPMVATGIVAAPALPAVALGQINQEGIDDARSKGATEEQAHDTAAAYLPAAALDYAADRLIIGKILKPLMGKVTIGQAVKHVLASVASEGGTEGAQQVWLNAVEKAGFRPDQQLTEGVLDSLIVGGLTGGTTTATGMAVSEGVRRSDGDITTLPAPATRPDGGANEALQRSIAADNARRGVPVPPPADIDAVLGEMQAAEQRQRETAAAAEAERARRAVEVAARRETLLGHLERAEQLSGAESPTFAEVQGALATLEQYEGDNSLRLDPEQRARLEQVGLQLTRRREELRGAEEARRAQAQAEAKAAADAADAQRTASAKAEQARLREIERTGRDESGRIVSLSRLPVEELQRIDELQDYDAEGVTAAQVETELRRRMQA